jgi:hypothetical protein
VTVTVPKWLVWTILAVIVIGGIAVGAYLFGRSSDEEGQPAAVEGTPTDETTASTPECSKNAARRAVLDSDFEPAVRDLGAVPPGDPLFGQFGYVLADLICRDFTSDGLKEMVVQLGCCTGGSPSPWAVFTPDNGRWRLAFHRENIPATLSVEGDAIVEKSPAYAAGDPTCCPSTYRFGHIRWDGSSFIFESDEAAAARTIKVGTDGATRVGSFNPQTGSPQDAAKSFGPPSFVGPNDELCVNEWRDLGLVINFANLGGGDPCSAEGRVGSIELDSPFAEQAGWKTTQGVRTGMSAEDLRQIYPDAQTRSYPGLRNALVLSEGPRVVGDGGTYPVLSARVEGEQVTELRLSVGAAGE